MNIWNIVFLVLIFILSAVAVFFTSQEMKIRQRWQEGIASIEKKTADAEKQRTEAIEGPAPDKPLDEKSLEELGLSDLILRLQDLVYERGQAWFGCTPGNISADGKSLAPQQLGGASPPTPDDRLKKVRLVEVKLTITGPVVDRSGNEEVVPPENLKGIAYLFDEGQEGVGGAFLGRFTVVGQAQKSQTGYLVTLQAANEMTEAEVQRIQRSSRSTWALYATVPKDRFEGIFSRLTEEDLENIPAALRNRLLAPDRPLKDFDELLTRLYQWRVALQQEIDQSKRDIAQLDASLEIAKNEEQSLEKDRAFETKRVQAMKDQVAVVQSKVDQYDATIKDMEAKIEQTQKRNEWYIAKIAEYQLKVAELIERRAEDVASQ